MIEFARDTPDDPVDEVCGHRVLYIVDPTRRGYTSSARIEVGRGHGGEMAGQSKRKLGSSGIFEELGPRGTLAQKKKSS